MLTMSTFSLLHEKNNFDSQFFVIISYYRFTYKIIGKKYWYQGCIFFNDFWFYSPPPLFGFDYLPHKIIPNQSIPHCLFTCQHQYINIEYELISWIRSTLVTCIKSTSIPGPSRWDGDEDPGKIRFIFPKFWEKNRMRSATRPYCNNGWIQLCLTAHAIFFPKFWNDKTNFTRVFVTVSPRRAWDRGWY